VRKFSLEGIDIAPFIPLSLHRSFKEENKLEEKHYLEEGEKIVYRQKKIEGEERKSNH